MTHRDVLGVLNIARLHGDGFNGVLAHPLLLRAEDAADVKTRAIGEYALYTSPP